MTHVLGIAAAQARPFKDDLFGECIQSFYFVLPTFHQFILSIT